MLHSCCNKNQYYYLDEKNRFEYDLGDTLKYSNINGDTRFYYINNIEQTFYEDEFTGTCSRNSVGC